MKKIVLLFAIISITILGCSKSPTTAEKQEQLQNIDKGPNLLGTGDSANDILSNDNFDKLLIEIAFVEGFRPTQQSIDNFTDYLKLHTFKEEIEVRYKSLSSPNEETLELEKIGALEIENRTAYNNGSTLAIYIYFSDAPSNEDEPEKNLVTLGAVYRNTSMIIYEATIMDLASKSRTITVTDVETATLNHEFGHLFGLVDIGTTPVNDHESKSENENGVLVGNNHCNVDGCLMRAELQFGGPTAVGRSSAKSKAHGLSSNCDLSGHSVLKMLRLQRSKGIASSPNLDSECILDLRSNGGR